MKYLFFDTETGGLDPSFSLLTMYAAVFDEKFKLIADIDLKLMPADGKFNVHPDAMRVNKIDLEQHVKVAVPYSVGAEQLSTFLEAQGTDSKLIPAGHNISFDMGFIRAYLPVDKAWKKFTNKIHRDTTHVGGFLKDMGLIPGGMGESLSAYAEFFGVKAVGPLHDAKNDVLLNARVYREMMEHARRERQRITSI